MLELPHTVVGATIATKIPNPWLAIPLAFLSHFPLDLIPHWNPSLYTETKKYGHPTRKSTYLVAIDVFLSLSAGGFIASRALPNLSQALLIILASFAAVSLDVVEGLYFFLGVRKKWLEDIINFQRSYQKRLPLKPGLLIQGLIIFLSLLIVYF
jgi:hypothetical protein